MKNLLKSDNPNKKITLKKSCVEYGYDPNGHEKGGRVIESEKKHDHSGPRKGRETHIPHSTSKRGYLMLFYIDSRF